MADVTWDRPGPGTWEFDASHSTRPMGRCFTNLYEEAFERGFAEGFERIGAPIETIKHANVNGWPYLCPRPLGGPAEPKGPPPKLLMTMLFALVPSLRARKRTAATLFVERPWRQAWDTWEQRGQPALDAELEALRDRDIAELSDVDLAEHLEELEDLGKRLVLNHFRNAPLTAVTVGDFLVHGERWAGVTPSDAMGALSGHCETTQRPLLHFERIIAALREDDAVEVLGGDSGGLAARIADASPTAAAHLAAYLREYGLHMVSGITVFDVTLEERPDVWHASLRARAGRSGSHDDAVVRLRRTSDRAAEAIRAAVPERHRSEWDEMLVDARRGLGIRESDVHLLCKTAGLLRHHMLEVGRRLVGAALADEPESALDLELAEARAVLRGEGPDGAQIRAFTAERKRQEKLDPPRHLGPRRRRRPSTASPLP